MTIILRIPANLLAAVRSDLARPHPFALERMAFLFCKAAHLADNGLLLLAAGYQPIAEADYLEDRSVGARMGPNAIRRALEHAYESGRQGLCVFHLHAHDHQGRPWFSKTDLRENGRFVPDFFNAAPAMPHGALVLSSDSIAGLCWRTKLRPPARINAFSVLGARLDKWTAA